MAGHRPSTQQALTLAALQLFTERYPASPRKTVQRYLTEQKEHAASYEPAVTDVLSPSAASPPQSTRIKRRLSSDDRAETALVLHSDDDEHAGRPGKKSARPSKEGERGSAARRKPSLVSALKPKQSPHDDAILIPTSSKSRVTLKSTQQPFGVVEEDSGSSPMLVPRIETAREQRKAVASEQTRKSSRKENEAVPVITAAKDRKGKGKAEAEVEPQETRNELGEDPEEVAERLRARRERRRAKAVIVKDRTQSAASKGAAAATKINPARPKSKRLSGENFSEDSSDELKIVPDKKKKRKATEAEIFQELSEKQKGKNIGTSRLTLKPPTKLGLFHNGAASVRTKVSKRLTDLTFSELDFLNAPRPSPPPREASSSSDAETDPAPKPSSKSAPHRTVKTYGSKAKKRRSSTKTFDAVLPSSSSGAPIRPTRKGKSRKEKAVPAPRHPPSPPRAPSPRKQKSKKAARPPRSPPPAAESSEGHSAHSLEQRRSRSASKEKGPARVRSKRPEETVLDTSSFWKQDHPVQKKDALAGPVLSDSRNFVQSSSVSAEKASSSSCNKQAGIGKAHDSSFDPNAVLSSPESIDSASLRRLLLAVTSDASVDYRPEVVDPPEAPAQHSVAATSDPVSGPSQFGPYLEMPSADGSSTEAVRREVAQGVVMGDDGRFRLAESSRGRDATSPSVGGSFYLVPGWTEPRAAAPAEHGHVWLPGRQDVFSPAQSQLYADSDFPSYSASAELNDHDLMPPPPLPSAFDTRQGSFSRRQEYQDPDRPLENTIAGAFGAAFGISAEEDSYRKAMTSHWYKSKC